jgi:hypothetical protein
MKHKTFPVKVKQIDIRAGNSLQILLNEAEAFRFGITAIDDVILSYKKNKKRDNVVVNVDLTNNLVDF